MQYLHILGRIISAGFLVAAATACGGGGGTTGRMGMLPSTLPPQTNSSSSPGSSISASIKVFIPAPAGSKSAKRRFWVSSATAGLLIQAANASTNQATGQVVADISPGSASCQSATNGRTCTIVIAVPAGNQTFTFKTYNTSPSGGSFGSATPVGIGIVTQQIIANTANTINVTLGGIVAGIQASLATTSVNFVPPAAPNVLITLEDPSGNAIVGGPYVDQNDNPVTLTLSATEDANDSVTVPTGAVTANSQIPIHYSGLAAAPFTSTITVTASNGPTSTTQLTVLQPQFRTFPVNVYPEGITMGPDNDVWFTTFNALNHSGGLGKVTPSGVVSYRGGPFGSMNVVTGPDANLWVTATNRLENALTIYKVNPGGTATSYSAPGNPQGNAPVADPITVGPDGALWYADQGDMLLGRITTSGTLTQYSTSETPQNLVGGSNGAIWFTQCPNARNQGSCSIGEMAGTSGNVTSYPAATNLAAENLYAIVAGSDGNLWFSQGPSNQQEMVCMSTSGAICGTYTLPQAILVQAIATNPDTAIWYADQGSSTIGRVMLNGSIATYSIPDANGLNGNLFVNDVTTGPDNGLWWTEYDTHGDYAIGTML